MSLFRRFLNPKSKSDKKQESPEKAERGKYMPEVKLPTDERFMLNFKNNGGKFLYCEDNKELQEAFDNILLENDWYEKECFCLDPTCRINLRVSTLILRDLGQLHSFFLPVNTW